MEKYKDIILSQPPAMYGSIKKNAAITLESYKGILLCGRPNNLQCRPSSQLRGGTAAGETVVLRKDGSVAPAFIPAGAAETQIGLGPSAEEKATMERNHRKRLENYKNNRANACTVLTRHRRWLRSFAAEVRKMKQEEIEREQELARQAEQLRRQQAQRRLCAEGGQSVKEAQQSQQQQAAVHADAEAKKPASAAPPKKAKKKKPKWALTEDEALEDELADADELLEFAKNLDYEKYISDYEIAGALAIMRERVEEIARENNWSKEAVEQAANEPLDDEGEDGVDDHEKKGAAAAGGGELRRQCATPLHNISTAAARKAAPCKFASHQKEWDNSTGIGNVLKRAIFRDTLRLAERILASSVSMQKIHTKYSLARVLQRCVLTGDNVAEAMQKPSIGGSKGLDELPRIVQVHPDATGLETAVDDDQNGGSRRVLVAMQRSKDRTQGLPYLYRCPAL